MQRSVTPVKDRVITPCHLITAVTKEKHLVTAVTSGRDEPWVCFLFVTAMTSVQCSHHGHDGEELSRARP